MTTVVVISLAALICSMVSAGCAVFVALRSQRWRDSDDARALIGRVGALETKVQSHETQISGLATKADVERVSGKIDTALEICRNASAGVDRIESIMLQGGGR